jgi:hypothetical protein
MLVWQRPDDWPVPPPAPAAPLLPPVALGLTGPALAVAPGDAAGELGADGTGAAPFGDAPQPAAATMAAAAIVTATPARASSFIGSSSAGFAPPTPSVTKLGTLWWQAV